MKDPKRLFCAMLAVLFVLPVAADSFADIRKKATTKGTVLGNAKITGIVIGDYRSQNMELCPNTAYNKVDLRVNKRTAYIESEDGKYGFRLVFDGIYDNRLSRGDKVSLDLRGCTVTRENNPERYTVSGLTAENVVSKEAGAPLPSKKRTINTLTDEDVYTFVTLEGVEFMSKQGSYTDIFERMAQCTYLNHYKPTRPNEYMDGWASLLKDKENASVYMLVNTKCTWRRDGRGVPKGVGSMSGIVVHTPMRRYGGDMGRYSIRPVDVGDVLTIPWEEASSYDIIAEWNWNRNYEAALKFEKAGEKRRAMRAEKYGDDRILPDVGAGFLFTDTSAGIRLDSDYDMRYANDNAGMRKYGCLRLEADVQNWLADGKGLFAEFSTEGLSGRALSFDFTFGAGNHDINNSWGFPAEWKVEYSTDGVKFVPAADRIILRSTPYTEGNVKGVGDRSVSYDAAFGFTEHSVALPASLFGQKKVVVRLSPASNRMAVIPADPSDDSIGGVISPDFKKQLILRIGMVSVKALR